jgi:hypothetical protein
VAEPVESADDLRRVVAGYDAAHGTSVGEEVGSVLASAGLTWSDAASAVRELLPWRVRVALDIADARRDDLDDETVAELERDFERLVVLLTEAWVAGVAAGLLARS